jgi:23S rRNA pseudouridine1911/1915/1917 synthase
MAAKAAGADVRELTAAGKDAGERLDIFLARHMPDWSRSQLQRLIRLSAVTVNGQAASKAGQRLEPGDLIAVRAEPETLRAAPEALKLNILYEDEDLAVVDKPAGMVVHVGAGAKSGTLVNALLHHLGADLSSAGGPLRPGIVHRLDKMTSGLILVAKNNAAHRSLAEQFKARSVHKQYQALVHGRLERNFGEIRASVGRDPVRRIRMKAGGIGAREAVTAYRVLRYFPHFTLAEAEPRTGRTHQIRVHFASIGHPVVGDTLYGAPGKIRLRGREWPTLNRNFLHAAHVELVHPRSGACLSFTAPLPPELSEFLEFVATEDR